MRGVVAPRWPLPPCLAAGRRPTPSTSTTSGVGATTTSQWTAEATWSCIPAATARRPSTSKSWWTRCGERGIGLPLLIRFSEIIKARVVELNEAFGRAISEYGYRGAYRGVYPIKVNQDRYLVERLVGYGRPYHYGLEAGSKPELLAVMAMLEDEEALIICNGYKDEEYIETALLASKLGRHVILVVEKPSELQLIRQMCLKMGVRPRLGVRSRLSAKGSGHWEASGGDRSKFGLTGRDLLDAVDYMKENDLLDTFELLHFHLGSQISSIRAVKDGLREASRSTSTW